MLDGTSLGQRRPLKKSLIRASGEEVDLPSKVGGVPVFEGTRLVFQNAGAGAPSTGMWSPSRGLVTF